MTFRLPESTHRTTIAGSTGSGKSQFACGLLATRDYTRRPWVIVDPKRDKLIAAIGPREIPVGGKPPTEPGLYVIHPKFGNRDHIAWQERFFEQIWEQEHTGVYVDEGYMVPNNSQSFLALLTQGRSKHIEMIICTQRPVRCHPFIFSESDFLCSFRQNKPADRDTIQDYMSIDTKNRLPKWHSYWYDVEENAGFILQPAPKREDILASFHAKLNRRIRTI